MNNDFYSYPRKRFSYCIGEIIRFLPCLLLLVGLNYISELFKLDKKLLVMGVGCTVLGIVYLIRYVCDCIKLAKQKPMNCMGYGYFPESSYSGTSINSIFDDPISTNSIFSGNTNTSPKNSLDYIDIDNVTLISKYEYPVSKRGTKFGHDVVDSKEFSEKIGVDAYRIFMIEDFDICPEGFVDPLVKYKYEPSELYLVAAERNKPSYTELDIDLSKAEDKGTYLLDGDKKLYKLYNRNDYSYYFIDGDEIDNYFQVVRNKSRIGEIDKD